MSNKKSEDLVYALLSEELEAQNAKQILTYAIHERENEVFLKMFSDRRLQYGLDYESFKNRILKVQAKNIPDDKKCLKLEKIQARYKSKLQKTAFSIGQEVEVKQLATKVERISRQTEANRINLAKVVQSLTIQQEQVKQLSDRVDTTCDKLTSHTSKQKEQNEQLINWINQIKARQGQYYFDIKELNQKIGQAQENKKGSRDIQLQIKKLKRVKAIIPIIEDQIQQHISFLDMEGSIFASPPMIQNSVPIDSQNSQGNRNHFDDSRTRSDALPQEGLTSEGINQQESNRIIAITRSTPTSQSSFNQRSVQKRNSNNLNIQKALDYLVDHIFGKPNRWKRIVDLRTDFKNWKFYYGNITELPKVGSWCIGRDLPHNYSRYGIIYGMEVPTQDAEEWIAWLEINHCPIKLVQTRKPDRQRIDYVFQYELLGDLFKLITQLLTVFKQQAKVTFKYPLSQPIFRSFAFTVVQQAQKQVRWRIRHKYFFSISQIYISPSVQDLHWLLCILIPDSHEWDPLLRASPIYRGLAVQPASLLHTKGIDMRSRSAPRTKLLPKLQAEVNQISVFNSQEVVQSKEPSSVYKDYVKVKNENQRLRETISKLTMELNNKDEFKQVIAQISLDDYQRRRVGIMSAKVRQQERLVRVNRFNICLVRCKDISIYF